MPVCAPMNEYQITIPLATVSSNHMVASAGDFAALRHRTAPVDHMPVTLVLVRPFIVAWHTRPCKVQPQMGVSSPPRPWLSQLNQWHTSANCFRFAVQRTPPPRLA